jgi:predicted nucleotidyltransferase
MPTAKELTKEQLKIYAANTQRRLSEYPESSIEQKEHEILLARIARAAKLLKSKFGVKRVILFGSLAHQGWYRSDSDVDLVVEGLSSIDFWKAWRLVENEIIDREVDLIEIESASDSLKSAIVRYGVEL